MSSHRYTAIEVLADCPKCGHPLPLNGPVLQLSCPSCQASVSPASAVEWGNTLLEIDEARVRMGSGEKRKIAVPRESHLEYVTYLAESPRCGECQAPLPTDQIAVGTQTELRCTGCGARVATYPAPQWLTARVDTVKQLYGADGGPRGADGVAPIDTARDASQPVVLNCPKCGGALTITAESTRMTPCEFCQAQVYLPDDLWQALHPVKTARRWYVRCEGTTKAQREQANQQRLQRAQEQAQAQAWAQSQAQIDAHSASMMEQHKSGSRVGLIVGLGIAVVTVGSILASFAASGMFGLMCGNKPPHHAALKRMQKQLKPRVSGRFEARSVKLGTWATEPTTCVSGERSGYFGAQLSRSGSPHWVRVVREPTGAISMVVRIKQTDRAVVYRSCKILSGHVKRTHVKVNGIWNVEGSVEIDCRNQQGKPVFRGKANFRNCH